MSRWVRRATLVGALLLSATPLVAQDAVVKEPSRFEDVWAAALVKKDGAAVGRSLAPRFLSMSDDGRLIDRATQIQETAEPALAQQNERRGFIGLGIGPSAPFGSFADASSTNTRGGRAERGYTDTFLNLGYRFRQRLGVAAAFSYSEYLMRGGGDDDWWQVAGLTVGPMYSLHLNPRAALDLKAMFGWIKLTPIVDSYTVDDPGEGSGFGVDLRAAVRYDVLRRWALFAEVGLQKSSGASFSSGLRNDYGALISGFGVAFRPAW